MRILIADDNRDSVETLSLLCQTWGFEPIHAYDGHQALALLHEPDSPMLCLLDWEMPGLTGIEICEIIRSEKDRPYLYMILITGRADRPQMVKGLDAGADDFLFKPVEVNELRARVSTGRRVLNLQEQLLSVLAQLKDQAARDGLTQLWNRSAIFEILEREISRGDRQASPLTVVLLDIDHFKSINDLHGHLAGDQVLLQFAQRLTHSLRPYDSVGRYGGEEFLIVLPGCPVYEAMKLVQRLRATIEKEGILLPSGRIDITASFGVACWEPKSTVADLVQCADNCLYVAKRNGRNRVIGPESASLPEP